MNQPDSAPLLPTDPSAYARLTEKLQALVDTIAPSNLFYQSTLKDAGLLGATITPELFCAHMPFTTRDAWVADQEHRPPYGSNLTFSVDAYTRFSRTSGSTGAPRIWLDTSASWQSMLENWKQVYDAANITAHNRLFFAFSFGPFLGFWTAFDAATQLGGLCVPGGGLSTDARLSLMADMRIDTLCCTPTYAIHMGQAARAKGMTCAPKGADLAVQRIIVAGEPGGCIPATRSAISKLWGNAHIIDHHGMTEVGPVTYQPYNHPDNLVVMESAYLAEVIDPESGTHITPGETGELVLTTLERTGSPLLRYRTGDLVRAQRMPINDNEPSALFLLGGILGRVDDMVIIRGVNVFPTAIENIVRAAPHVVEYQVEINESDAMRDLSIRVEWHTACPDPAQASESLSRDLRDALALRIPVQSVPIDTLPRYELKARRWIRRDDTTGATP
jgi:phenylacetate-CoA ligase